MEGQVDIFAQGFIAPMKTQSRPGSINSTRSSRGPNGTLIQDPDPQICADNSMMTGSRFPNPSNQITNQTVDLTRSPVRSQTEPNSGRTVGDPNDPNAPADIIWKYDARQNVFWMGYLPVFYWPRFAGETDDLEAPLRQFAFRTTTISASRCSATGTVSRSSACGAQTGSTSGTSISIT